MSKTNLSTEFGGNSVLQCLKRDYLKYNEYEYDNSNLTWKSEHDTVIGDYRDKCRADHNIAQTINCNNNINKIFEKYYQI